MLQCLLRFPATIHFVWGTTVKCLHGQYNDRLVPLLQNLEVEAHKVSCKETPAGALQMMKTGWHPGSQAWGAQQSGVQE